MFVDNGFRCANGLTFKTAYAFVPVNESMFGIFFFFHAYGMGGADFEAVSACYAIFGIDFNSRIVLGSFSPKGSAAHGEVFYRSAEPRNQMPLEMG